MRKPRTYAVGLLSKQWQRFMAPASASDSSSTTLREELPGASGGSSAKLSRPMAWLRSWLRAGALPLEREVGAPRHVAIIMDGNGRWAKARNLPRFMGHRAGVEALRRIVRAAPQLGIEVLTVYAFSTENWRRPKDEVDALMELLLTFLRSEIQELDEQGVCLRLLGYAGDLPPRCQEELTRAQEKTANNTRLTLNLAINYGSRKELVHAMRILAADCVQGRRSPESIDEAAIASALYTAGQPDPDLVIRPSGEWRLSNFLLWQSAYAELYVTDVLWPDFKPEHLSQAIESYRRRDRRFGGVRSSR